MQKLSWTAPARADLRSIEKFLIQEASAEVTVRMLLAIRQRANLLMEFPHAGPIVEDRSFRSLKVLGTPYLLTYRIHAGFLEILRIFHDRENWRGSTS